MSQGRKELRRVALRYEGATPGVRVAPRFLWRGMAEMPDDQREVTNREELVGIFGGYADTYVPKLYGEITLSDTEATFEQIGIVFAAAGFGSVGGSTHGASGSAVSFYYPLPSSTVWPTQSFTIEAGEPANGMGGEAEVGTYGVVREIKLSGAGGEAVKVETTWMVRTWERTNALGTFSAAGTAPPVETIIAGRGTAYLDQAVSGATFGASAVPAGNILGFETSFKDMWEGKWSVDSGQLYFHTAVFVGYTIEGELTFESQATGTQSILGTAGLKQQAFRDQIPYLLRQQWSGGTINLGTGFVNKLFRMDLPITATKVDPLDDQNGNSITTLQYFSKQILDVPAAGRGTILVVRRDQQEMIN